MYCYTECNRITLKKEVKWSKSHLQRDWSDSVVGKNVRLTCEISWKDLGANQGSALIECQRKRWKMLP